jgi:hypothetical protein
VGECFATFRGVERIFCSDMWSNQTREYVLFSCCAVPLVIKLWMHRKRKMVTGYNCNEVSEARDTCGLRSKIGLLPVGWERRYGIKRSGRMSLWPWKELLRSTRE